MTPSDNELSWDEMNPLEFGHTLTGQIGGQLDAGFVLTGFFEDQYGRLNKRPAFPLHGEFHCHSRRETLTVEISIR